MAAKPPDAFVSYTRFNDRYDGGAISEFCRRLESAVEAVTGVPFEIFQDVEGIGIGEHWPGKLDQMLNEVRFFIPIVTPSYFTSKPCRDELEKFLQAEANRGRNDLVLPIYYIECEVLEDDDLRADDPLASTLHKRQRQDWRELRFEPFDAGNVRRTLEQLARDIVRARRRPMPQAAEQSQKRAEEETRRRSEARPAESLVTETHRSELKYHDPGLTGRITFNYSNNNGSYSIGRDEFFFETQWSKASDQSIYLLNDPPSIAGVAEAPDVRSYRDVKDPASYDMSSRVRTIQEGEHAILKNRHSKYAVLRVLDIKDRTRSDAADELSFEFWILSDTTTAEHKADEEEVRRRAEEAGKAGAAEDQFKRAEEAEAKRQTKRDERKAASNALEPGTVFREIDAPWCPEMVVIPPGEFMMGSTDVERQLAQYETPSYGVEVRGEKPQHLVRIAYPLMVGRYPVTFEEYDHFVAATGRDQPDDEGWGRGRRPVINVSWNDAKAYVKWLAAETGQRYRLLSEAEWEYACRAGTTTRYWWGDGISPEKANYGANVGKTSGVGTYSANPFGLYDMHGNVWEWVEDDWHRFYDGAPDDGSAWITEDDCRVARGGCYTSESAVLRSAARGWKVVGERKAGVREIFEKLPPLPDLLVTRVGFRVARQFMS